MSETKKEKQNFLREEIIDKGYNGAHFANFLDENRTEGGDVDNWSLDSLEDVVSRYRDEFPKPEDTFPEDSEPDSHSDAHSVGSHEEKTEEINPLMKGEESEDIVSDEKNELSSLTENESNFQQILGKDNNMNKKVRKESIRDVNSDEEKEIMEQKSEKVLPGPQLPTSFVKQRKMMKDKEKKEKTKKEDRKRSKGKSSKDLLKMKKPKKQKRENKDNSIKENSEEMIEDKITIDDIQEDSNEMPMNLSSDKKQACLNELKRKVQFKKEHLVEYNIEIKTMDIRLPTPLTEQSIIRVLVTDPQLVKPGFLKSNYISYKVSTAPLGFEVKRRFSDFFWLYNILMREYPTYYIPPCARKGSGRQFDKYHIEKRMSVLQLFLDSVLSHRELRSSPYVLAFLNMQNDKQWQKAKSEFDKKITRISGFRENINKKIHGKGRLTVEAFSNLEGLAKCRISNDLRHFSRGLEDLNKNLIPYNDRLKEGLKQLMNDYDNICRTLSQLADTTKQMEKVHQYYNSKVEFGKTTINQDIYNSMTSSFQNLQKHYTEKVTTIQETILKQVKYSKYEMLGINELLRIRNKIGQDYFKTHLDLEETKEKLYNQGINPNWGIDTSKLDLSINEIAQNKEICKFLMLPEHNHQVKNLQKLFGYMNVQLYNETVHLHKHRAIRYLKSMTELCNDNINILGKSSLLFQNLNSKLCEIYAQVALGEKNESQDLIFNESKNLKRKKSKVKSEDKS